MTRAVQQSQPIDARPAGMGARWAAVAQTLRRHPSLTLGAAILVLMSFTALFPGLFTDANPVTMNIPQRMQPPSLAFPFGTDQYGRDILARVLYGGRYSLVMGTVPIALAAGVGIVLGLIAGYYGKLADLIIMRIMDVWVAFPIILLALAIVTVLGPGLINIMIAIGIAWVPYYTRMVRSVVLSLRNTTYVEAAQVLGLGDGRILRRHIFPNTLAPLIVMSSMGIAGAILTGASLSFIGLGPQAPTPEWGVILADGRQFIRLAWWIGFFPGVAIALTVLGANLLGDGLRDWLDPRMKV
jgi:peptide/nickel transport system permease protein